MARSVLSSSYVKSSVNQPDEFPRRPDRCLTDMTSTLTLLSIVTIGHWRSFPVPATAPVAACPQGSTSRAHFPVARARSSGSARREPGAVGARAGVLQLNGHPPSKFATASGPKGSGRGGNSDFRISSVAGVWSGATCALACLQGARVCAPFLATRRETSRARGPGGFTRAPGQELAGPARSGVAMSSHRAVNHHVRARFVGTRRQAARRKGHARS